MRFIFGLCEKIFNSIMIYIMSSKIIEFVILHILPKFRLTTDLPLLNGNQFYKIQSLLNYGDLLFKVDEKSPSSLLIGGMWSHVAVYIGKNQIVEMTSDGHVKSTLFDLCKGSDHVAIGRIRASDEYISQFAGECILYNLTVVGYDTSFDLNSFDKMYCSEMIYHADVDKVLDIKLSSKFGYTYVSPDDVFNSSNIDIVYNSRD